MGHAQIGPDWWTALGWLALPLFWAVMVCARRWFATALRRDLAPAALLEPCPVECEARALDRDAREDRSAAA
jgi:hypothetical protein